MHHLPPMAFKAHLNSSIKGPAGETESLHKDPGGRIAVQKSMVDGLYVAAMGVFVAEAQR